MLCHRDTHIESCTRMGGIQGEKDSAMSHDASGHSYLSIQRAWSVCAYMCVFIQPSSPSSFTHTHTDLTAVITPSNNAGRGITAAVFERGPDMTEGAAALQLSTDTVSAVCGYSVHPHTPPSVRSL